MKGYNIKGITRTARWNEANRRNLLSQSMHLPPQKVARGETYHKIQLADVIVESLLAQKQQLASTNHKLVIQGELHYKLKYVMANYPSKRFEEESDVIIIH